MLKYLIVSLNLAQKKSNRFFPCPPSLLASHEPHMLKVLIFFYLIILILNIWSSTSCCGLVFMILILCPNLERKRSVLTMAAPVCILIYCHLGDISLLTLMFCQLRRGKGVRWAESLHVPRGEKEGRSVVKWLISKGGKEKKEFLRFHCSQFQVAQAVKEQRKKTSKALCSEFDNIVIFCDTTIFFPVLFSTKIIKN